MITKKPAFHAQIKDYINRFNNCQNTNFYLKDLGSQMNDTRIKFLTNSEDKATIALARELSQSVLAYCKETSAQAESFLINGGACADDMWGLARIITVLEKNIKNEEISIIQIFLEKIIAKVISFETLSAKNLGNISSALGKIAGCNQKFIEPISIETLTNFGNKSLQLKNADALAIANIIWGIGKYAGQRPEILSRINSPDIAKLILQLTTLQPSTQQISNTLLSLGRFTEQHAESISAINPQDIATLVNQLTLGRENDAEFSVQTIANTFWGLGQCAERQPESVAAIAPEDIAILVNQLALAEDSSQLNQQTIANTFSGLGKCIRANPKLLPLINSQDIASLVTRLILLLSTHKPHSLAQSKFTISHILETLVSLGRCAEQYSNSLADIVPQDIATFFNQLALIKHQLNAHTIASIFWSLGRYVTHHSRLLSATQSENIILLVSQFIKLQPTALDIANVLFGLEKYSGVSPDNLADIERLDIAMLVHQLPELKSDARSTPMIFASLGRWAESCPAILKRINSQVIADLFKQFVKLPSSAPQIANILLGLGKYARIKPKVLAHIGSDNIAVLIMKLLQLPLTTRSIANVFEGLGKCVEQNRHILSDIEPQDISDLTNKLIPMSPEADEIGSIFWSIGRCAEQYPHILSGINSQDIVSVIKKLTSHHPAAHDIANILRSLMIYEYRLPSEDLTFLLNFLPINLQDISTIELQQLLPAIYFHSLAEEYLRYKLPLANELKKRKQQIIWSGLEMEVKKYLNKYPGITDHAFILFKEVDFYIASTQTIIEVDGPEHDKHSKQTMDNIHEKIYKDYGYNVIRIDYKDWSNSENKQSYIHEQLKDYLVPPLFAQASKIPSESAANPFENSQPCIQESNVPTNRKKKKKKRTQLPKSSISEVSAPEMPNQEHQLEESARCSFIRSICNCFGLFSSAENESEENNVALAANLEKKRR